MARRYEQTMSSFWRGMLQRRTPRARPSGYLNEALNTAMIGGVAVGRAALVPFTYAAFPAPLRGHGFHVKSDGTRQTLAACANGIVYRCFDGGDPIELSFSALPATEQTRVDVEKVYFLSLSGGTNTTYIYDGVNPNLKWDGERLTRLGIPPAPPAAVPTEDPGDITPGTRNYAITLVSPTHETNPSEVLRVVTIVEGGGNKQETFTSPVQGVDFDDPQVTLWRLWRTTAGGAELKLIDEADIAVAIVDNTTDTTLLGRDKVEDLFNDDPTDPATGAKAHAIALVEHRGQLAGVFSYDPNIVRFSNTDPDYMVPEGWPLDFVQPVAHSDGDTITALASFFEWLVVFKQNSTYAIVGDSFEEYRVVPVLANGATRQGIGTFSPGCVLQVENALLFAARDGIYRIDRFADASGGIKAERISGQVDDLYAAVRFSLGTATFFDRKRRLFAYLGHG